MNKLTRAGFNKRITLIKSDIFRDFTSSDDYEKLSFYQVLNRIVILIQYSVCFVLYKKVGDFNTVSHYFLQDKLHIKSLEKYLSSISSGIDNYLFNIYDSDYSLLVFTINKDNKKRIENGLNFKVIENCVEDKIDSLDSYISSCCKTILGSDKKYNNNLTYKGLILKSITNLDKYVEDRCQVEIVDKSIENFGKNIKNEFNEIYGVNEVAEKLDNHDYIYLKKKGCFNNIYKRVGKSIPLIDNNKNSFHGLSNVFFNIRDYYMVGSRFSTPYFSGYKYNISYIFPEEKGYDLDSFLQFLKNSGKNSFFSYTSYVKKNDYLYTRNSTITLEQAREIDIKFWDILVSDDGVRKLKEIMRSSFGENARSFSDRVYNDGILYFYLPFELGGFRRINNANLNDKIRVVLLYYYASIYFDYNELTMQKIAIIVSPIMISNTVWGTMSHFILIDETSEEFKNMDTWLQNYQYYNSIVIRSEKILRLEIKNSYLAFIKVIYLMNFQKYVTALILANRDEDKIINERNKLERNINDKFEELTYFFPFSKIIIRVEITGKERNFSNDIVYYLAKSGFISFEKSRNRFYPNIENIKNIMNDISIKNDIIPNLDITQKSLEDDLIKKGDELHEIEKMDN